MSRIWGSHLSLPSTWCSLLSCSNLGQRAIRKWLYSQMCPRELNLILSVLNRFLPGSYTSWLSSITKEIHSDHEVILSQLLSFYIPALVRRTKQITAIHPFQERWLHQSYEVPSFSTTAHTSPLRQYKDTNSPCLEIKLKCPSNVCPFGSLIPFRNNSCA